MEVSHNSFLNLILFSNRILELAWKEQFFHGSWIEGVSAGGCSNYRETFPTNPQFKITLKDFDDEDDKCTVIVALLRKNVLGDSTEDDIAIGFKIYDVSKGEGLSLFNYLGNFFI